MHHQLHGHAALVNPLQLRQLRRAVDTGDLGRVADFVRYHRHTIGHGKLHDIRQVILVLRVVVVQPRQPGLELPGGHGHDAAIDLGDGALLG